MSNPLLLFVCTGNVCRSPMAEYMLRARLGPASPWRVGSAGVAAVEGAPASAPAVSVLREMGLDLRPHRSRQLTPELVDAAALLVVMTNLHSVQIRMIRPRAAERIFLLKSFDPVGDRIDIADPIGLSTAQYRQTRDEIEEALPGLVSFMKSLDVT